MKALVLSLIMKCKSLPKDCLNDKTQLKTVKITEVEDASKYDAIFFAGGNGVVWDFKDNEVCTIDI